ncbi:MAG: L-serine ammonia-lyase, iron-sulfur-dependent, subunit alpha [Bacteroidetes bacterium HGW-Bacteroidetes-21]|jgi:L-serine dehydratase|nr:MAG: L-serine ammonia-lyase, iron-sulfur-dependent, subunit alpha [Bacteroidetes bacterium HGW-Bacteroidetes-21]
MPENMGSFIPKCAESYFSPDEISYCIQTVTHRIENGETGKTFHHKEEIEECIVHDFSHSKLKKTLLSLKPYNYQPYTLYRIVSHPEKNYMITVFYNDITSATHTNVALPDIDLHVDEMLASEKGFDFTVSVSGDSTTLQIRSINSSKFTVINNVIETFQKHLLFPSYTELWYLKSKNKKIKSLYILNCVINKAMPLAETESMHNDFERYLHRYIKPMSVFDIVGPSMVGPSSSHTAGANKIGQIARSIMLALAEDKKLSIASVDIKLLGSFRDTGPGHRTPAAIGGGLWGLGTDHPDMLLHGDPSFLKQKGIDFGSQQLTFGGYQRGSAEEDQKYKNENNNNIAEIIFHTNEGNFIITGFSIGGGNVEVRYLNQRLSTPLNGKDEFFISDGRIISPSEARKCEHAVRIQPIYLSKPKPKGHYSLPFNSFEELLTYLEESGKQITDIIYETEYNLQGSSKADIMSQTAEYWSIMKKAVKKGIMSNELSLLKLTGKDANKLHRYSKKNLLFDNLFGRAVIYAVAVNEVNAKSGVIVACPTAGSCGILPGVLKAYDEVSKPTRERLLESILVSGFLGMILFNDVTTAGADYGCQAEVGVGAAMAAAALTYLEHGNMEQVVQAFTLAVKNSLGLICDPVAGLVEVPCVKRNGVFASVAISASMMSLAGVRSFVSPDEVVLTMKEVGDKLHRDFKETAGGGLAKTRDGKAVDRAFESEVKRFFGNS